LKTKDSKSNRVEPQGPTEAGPRKWIQRFRKRWRLHLGTLPVQEILPIEDSRAKAFTDLVLTTVTPF